MPISEALAPPNEAPVIKFSGIFDFDSLYGNIISWLKNREYKFSETKYNYKPAGLGKELEIAWEAEKKITHFYKWKYTLDFHIWDYQDIEVIQDGKKNALVKARLELKLMGTVEMDYSKRFNTPFLRKLLNWYFSTIWLRYFMFSVWDPYYSEMYDLHTEIKKQIGMMTV